MHVPATRLPLTTTTRRCKWHSGLHSRARHYRVRACNKVAIHDHMAAVAIHQPKSRASGEAYPITDGLFDGLRTEALLNLNATLSVLPRRVTLMTTASAVTGAMPAQKGAKGYSRRGGGREGGEGGEGRGRRAGAGALWQISFSTGCLGMGLQHQQQQQQQGADVGWLPSETVLPRDLASPGILPSQESWWRSDGGGIMKEETWGGMMEGMM